MNSDEPPCDGAELHRLCRLRLALTCGHRVVVDLNGWYPVVVPCCDRLGGTVLCGRYVPYSPEVEYVAVIEERYEWRPAGSPREPLRVIDTMPRTDQPAVFAYSISSGRFPRIVGSTWVMDGHTV